MPLSRCVSCSGFSPSKSEACVHCGGELRRSRSLLTGAIVALGASVASCTMMAVYGAPACPDNKRDDAGYCHYNDDEADAGTAADAGQTDGGVDGGP